MDARRMWLPSKINLAQSHQAGNYVGWPMLNERNVQKYYPETTETAKGHLNQTRKNVRSTKAKAPLETCDTSQLVRPTKVGNAIMMGIGSRQNPYTP